MNPEIFVTRPALPPLEEYIEEIKKIWDSGWLTNMGKMHENLERELKTYLKVDGLSLMSSGHMALELCLQAMNLTGEVITTPFTFASTTHAIVRSGLKPVFCDIDPGTYTIDAKKIEDLITKQTCAIVPVHVYGNVCDTKQIEEIAKKYSLKVIYDAAHAFGVKVGERGIGSFGDASIFSFHATKVFHTIEGGAVSFSDPALSLSLYHLKNFGIMGPESVEGIGANAKMNEFQAAMGLCNLRYIKENIQKRRRLWEQYQERLAKLPGLVLPKLQKGVSYNYGYFPLMIEEEVFGCSRDRTAQLLEESKIMVRKYFYPLTSDFACYEGRLDPGNTPIAKKAAAQVMTLPLYPELTASEVERICSRLWQIHQKEKGF